MFRLRTILMMLVFAAASLPAFAQNVVADPQHRFTVEVPQGWRVLNNDEGMKLSMGDAFVHIIHVEPQSAAMKVAQTAIAVSGESFAGVQETERGETTLGGDHAVFVSYIGYDDRSISTNLHIVATESGWVFFAAVPDVAFSSLRPVFHKMQESFHLTKNIPGPAPTPEK